MANGGPESITNAPEDDGGAPDPGGSPGGAPPGAPSPGGPPGGANPLIAALAQRRQQPGISAPGPGDQAGSMTMIMNGMGMFQQALQGLQPGSPLYHEVSSTLTRMSRHLSRNAQPMIGPQMTQMRDMVQATARNALLNQIMSQRQQGGGQGQPPAPMPSTPLPGA